MSKPLIWILGIAAWLLLAIVCVNSHSDMSEGAETKAGEVNAPATPKPLMLGKINGQWQLTGSVPNEIAKAALIQQSKLQLGDEEIIDQLEINPSAQPIPADFPPDLRGLRNPLAQWDGHKLSLQGLASSEKTLNKIRTSVPESMKAGLQDGLSVDAQAQERVQSQIKVLLENPLEFEEASHRLTAVSQQRLNAIATQLEQVPDATVLIGGHTDNRGKDKTNFGLSQSRADSVRDYLVEKGLPAERFQTKAYGSTQPVSDNKTEDGRARNRRIEFTLQ